MLYEEKNKFSWQFSHFTWMKPAPVLLVKIMIPLYYRTYEQLRISACCFDESGGKKMEYFGLLAPIAFVFSLAALSQITALKKEVARLEEELKNKQ